MLASIIPYALLTFPVQIFLCVEHPNAKPTDGHVVGFVLAEPLHEAFRVDAPAALSQDPCDTVSDLAAAPPPLSQPMSQSESLSTPPLPLPVPGGGTAPGAPSPAAQRSASAPAAAPSVSAQARFGEALSFGNRPEPAVCGISRFVVCAPLHSGT
jgi:hypothetical protein